MASTNPFYPGYYPGEPLYKRPVGGEKYKPPSEPMDWAGLDAYINSIEIDAANAPRFFIDNIKDDFKSSLTAKSTVPSSGLGEADIARHGEEATEDLPGAFGISISLNPQDWAKDPLNQVKKTIVGWRKAALDYDDLDAFYREELWIKALSRPQSYERRQARFANMSRMERYVARVEEAGAGAVSEGASRGAGIYVPGSYNPLSVDDLGVYEYRDSDVLYVPSFTVDEDGNPRVEYVHPRDAGVPEAGYVHKGMAYRFGPDGNIIEAVGGRDPYRSFKTSVASFQRGSRSSITREKAYDSVITSAANALNADIKQNFDPTSISDSVKRAEIQGFLGSFERKLALANSIGSFDDKKQLVGVSEALDKYILTGDSTGLSELHDNLRGNIKHARKAIGNLTAEDRNALGKAVDLYEKRLSALEVMTLPGGSLRVLKFGTNKRLALQAKRQLDDIRSGGMGGIGIGGGNLLDKGIRRQVLRQLESDIKNDKHGVFENNTKGGRIIRTVFPRLERERSYNEVAEFLDAVDNERFLRQYIWPRFKSKFEVYTPGYWLGKSLDRSHRALFVVNSDLVKKAPKGVDILQEEIGLEGRLLFSTFLINERSKIGKSLLNNITIDFGSDIRDEFGNLRFAGTALKIKTVGGAHFKFVRDISDWYAEGLVNEEGLKLLLNPLSIFSAAEITQGGRLLSISEIMKNPALFAKFEHAFIEKAHMPIPFTRNDLEKFAAGMERFDDWVKANFTAAQYNNPDFRRNLFERLHKMNRNPDYLPLDRKFVGYLEKIKQKVNIWQTKLLTHPILGKPLKILFMGKNILAEKLVDFISRIASQALSKLLAIFGSSTGVGAPIMAALGKALQKVMYVIIKKSIDTLQAFGKAVFTGDFSKLMDSFDDTVNAVMKFTFYVILLPLSLVIMIGFLVSVRFL
jgi:hypothetical protein